MVVVYVARFLGLILFIILSFGLHFFLFFEKGNSYWNIWFQYAYMHIIYFLLTLIITEHLYNFWERRKIKKPSGQTPNKK